MMLKTNMDSNTFWMTAYMCAVEAQYASKQGEVTHLVVPFGHYMVGLRSVLDGKANLTKCSIRNQENIHAGSTYFILDFDNNCSIAICAYNHN